MEIPAHRPVLFTGGKKNKPFVELRYCSSKDSEIAGEKVRITYDAIDRLGGADRPIRLLPNGVELTDKTMLNLPFIRVRSVGRDSRSFLTRFLISEPEAVNLRDELDLPAEVMAGAFFRFVDHKLANPVRVIPSWQELVMPDWERGLRGWVGDPAGHPVPDGLPWSSRTGMYMFLPGVEGLVPYPSPKVKGELRFAFTNGLTQAVFDRPGKKQGSAVYLLHLVQDKIVAEYQLPETPQKPAAGDSAFDGRAFTFLFAPEDSFLFCRQRAEVRGFYFSPDKEVRLKKNCHPVALQLRISSKVPLTPGVEYFFAFFRHQQEAVGAIYAVCFEDEARTKMACWARFNFDSENRLRGVGSVTLQPGPGDDVLRGWLEAHQ